MAGKNGHKRVEHLSDLTPDPRNARRHNPRNIGQVQASLQKYGAARSIVIDEAGQIIAGHGVVEAAALAGIERVQVVDADGETIIAVRRSGLTRQQKQELGVADNRGAELATWDADVLASLAGEIDLGQFWQKDELDDLLRSVGGGSDVDAEPQIDRAEELRQKWGVEAGQLWQLGEHRLLCGDSTKAEDVGRVMAGEKAGAVVTDPPYGIGWDTDYTRFTTEYGTKRVKHPPVANDDREFDPRPWMEYPQVVLWGANWYCKHIPVGSWLIWDKRHPNGTAWLSDAELAWAKGGRGIYIYAETVQGAHRKEQAMHPTQKPVGLIEWCILRMEKTDVIFDPFLGSGTTLIACERLGRKCRAIEISPGYVAVTLERWATATGKTPVRV